MNRKGQFFIISAVFMMAAIAAVFFYLSARPPIQTPSLISDGDYLFRNIGEEAHMTVELVLETASNNLSMDQGDITNLLNSELNTYFTFAEGFAAQRGMSLDTAFSPVSVSNQSITAQINLTLSTQKGVMETSFNTISEINISNTGIDSTSPCQFSFIVEKEYGEPERGLSAYVGIINSTGHSMGCTVNETTSGYYANCTGSCGGSSVILDVTDFRGIHGIGN